jgi:ribosomal protein RSM22 (predicted rRNA methylase)
MIRATLSTRARRTEGAASLRFWLRPLLRCSDFSTVEDYDKLLADLDLTPHGYGDDDDESKVEPWKTLLEYPARAAWRVTKPLQEEDVVSMTLKNVLSTAKRRKHLRQILETTIIAQRRELANRRERERARARENRSYKPEEQRRDAGLHPVLYGRDECFAMYYFRFFPYYSITLRVLEEVSSLLGKTKAAGGSFKPKRVIDFGVGTGSASAAACAVWPDSLEWIHGVDASETMRDSSKFMLDELWQGKPNAPRSTFAAHLASSTTSQFDLALFTYTASDLTHNDAILAAAAMLWRDLAPNGVFVMIEPGTPDGFTSIRMVRNMLLASNEKHEIHVVAPCTHQGPCPLLGFPFRAKPKFTQKDITIEDYDKSKDVEDEDEDEEPIEQRGFCSFVQTMPGKVNKGEKFSYLVVQKRDAEYLPDSHRFDDVSMVDLMKRTVDNARDENAGQKETDEIVGAAHTLEIRFLDSDDDILGLELVRGDNMRSSFGRIVSAPKKNRGHVLIDTCVGPGKIVRSKISKSTNVALPGLFTASRKSRWGGFWPDIPFLRDLTNSK